MSLGLPRSARSSAPVERGRTLRVQTVFRDLDEQQAQAISAELIDRAHELANMPDCACDLDVSVEVVAAQEDGAGAERTS